MKSKFSDSIESTPNLHHTATDSLGCSGSRPYTLTPVLSDFGDWSGAGAATPTTTSTRNANLRLGLTVDAGASVTANPTATADDTTNTGRADDEEGATSLPATITKGTNSTITLSVFNNTGVSAYLHSWIDLNGDGTFNDGVVTTSPGERLEAVRTIPTNTVAQTVNITFTVPSWAVTGASRGVRFRLTNLNTTLPTGVSGSGEIEDYVTTIACPTITMNPATLTNPIQGFAYSATLTATGGNRATGGATGLRVVPLGSGAAFTDAAGLSAASTSERCRAEPVPGRGDAGVDGVGLTPEREADPSSAPCERREDHS